MREPHQLRQRVGDGVHAGRRGDADHADDHAAQDHQQRGRDREPRGALFQEVVRGERVEQQAAALQRREHDERERRDLHRAADDVGKQEQREPELPGAAAVERAPAVRRGVRDAGLALQRQAHGLRSGGDDPYSYADGKDNGCADH